jgi:hypothetical protein
MEVKFVTTRTIAGLGNWFVTLEIVLGAVVDGVGELVTAVEGAVSPGDGAASVEPSGLVEHHLIGLALTDLLVARTGGFGGLLCRVALLEAVGVELEHVGRPGHDADALVAVENIAITSAGRRQDHVTSQTTMAISPGWNGVE